MDPREALELIETRRSIRKYLDKPIPDDVLERIVRAGTFAATGAGSQSPMMIVVRNKEVRDRLMEMNKKVLREKFGMKGDSDPFYGAPAVIVVLADKARMTHVEDGSICLANLMLQAHAEGLGSCWIHRAQEEFEWAGGKELLAELGIEGNWEGVGNLILGYPDGEAPQPAPRKDGWFVYVD